jgi:hypothetical protein
MRITSFFKFYILLISCLLIVFAAFPNLASLKSEIFLFIAVSLLSPYIFKEALKVRGVKKGDIVLISMKDESPFGFFMKKTFAKAISHGKVGDVIDIEFNSRRGKGEIVNYGGIFFPPEVNLLYYEENFVQREVL